MIVFIASILVALSVATTIYGVQKPVEVSTSTSQPDNQQKTATYIANNPSKFSFWEVKKAIDEIKAKR